MNKQDVIDAIRRAYNQAASNGQWDTEAHLEALLDFASRSGTTTQWLKDKLDDILYG